eukprot:SM000049S16704  [mRNA]  locus=s49:113182:113623:- [translate_table: standard]
MAGLAGDIVALDCWRWRKGDWGGVTYGSWKETGCARTAKRRYSKPGLRAPRGVGAARGCDCCSGAAAAGAAAGGGHGLTLARSRASGEALAPYGRSCSFIDAPLK